MHRRILRYLPIAVVAVLAAALIVTRIACTPAPQPPPIAAPLIQPALPTMRPYHDTEDARAAWDDGYAVGVKFVTDAYRGPQDAPMMPRAED